MTRLASISLLLSAIGLVACGSGDGGGGTGGAASSASVTTTAGSGGEAATAGTGGTSAGAGGASTGGGGAAANTAVITSPTAGATVPINVVTMLTGFITGPDGAQLASTELTWGNLKPTNTVADPVGVNSPCEWTPSVAGDNVIILAHGFDANTNPIAPTTSIHVTVSP